MSKPIKPTWRNLAAIALIEARASLATEFWVAGVSRSEITYTRAAMAKCVNPYAVRRNAANRAAMVAASDYLDAKSNATARFHTQSE